MAFGFWRLRGYYFEGIKTRSNKQPHLEPKSLDPRPDVSIDSVLFSPESPGAEGTSPNYHDQVNLVGRLPDKRHRTSDDAHEHGAEVSSEGLSHWGTLNCLQSPQQVTSHLPMGPPALQAALRAGSRGGVGQTPECT